MNTASQSQRKGAKIYTANGTYWATVVQIAGRVYRLDVESNTNLSMPGNTLIEITNHVIKCISSKAYFKIGERGYQFNIRQLTEL